MARIVWITNDGTIFNNEKEAINYDHMQEQSTIATLKMLIENIKEYGLQSIKIINNMENNNKINNIIVECKLKETM